MKRLLAEAELADPKDVPEELNEKIDKLMEASAAKFHTYCELLLFSRPNAKLPPDMSLCVKMSCCSLIERFGISRCQAEGT